MKNRQWRYYLLYWLMVFFPAHYLGAQGIAYQSVEVDSLINPPLLKEGLGLIISVKASFSIDSVFFIFAIFLVITPVSVRTLINCREQNKCV